MGDNPNNSNPNAPSRNSSRGAGRDANAPEHNGRRGDGATGSYNGERDSNPRAGAEPTPYAPPSANGTPSPSDVARRTWSEIGTNFVRNRERSRNEAYKNMQLEIMKNCAILTPDYLSLKDTISISMDIEKFLKENPDSTGEGKSPLDVVADFLRGETMPIPDLNDEEAEAEDEDDNPSIVRVI